MYDNDLNKIQTVTALYGCEQLTQEYKKVLNSQEYKLGKSILQYKTLLMQGKILVLLKRLFTKGKKYNKLFNDRQKCITHANHFSNKKIAVYTAIFGSYDELLEPVIQPDNIDYFIITDQEIPLTSKWRKLDGISFPSQVSGNIKKNRYVKMFPDKLFESYDYSIYVDGNVLITSDLTPLIEQMTEFPISMHRHKNRNCVYEEIEACIQKGKANRKDLLRHKSLLEKHNVPKYGGLLEATIIARKHSEPLCKEIMNKWWKEFTMFSKRDQISLIDILWQSGIDVDQVAIMGNNTFANNLFVIVPHK